MKQRLSYLWLIIGGTPFQAPPQVEQINKNVTLPKLVQYGVTMLLSIAAMLSIFYLLWGGIQWISSGGDKHGIEVARNKIIYALIGLAVTFLSFFILSALGYMFGVTLIGV